MIGMCSGGMSSSSLVLGAYLCGCPHAALYHIRHLIFSFTSRFTSVSILIHTVDKVDSFSTEHSKNTLFFFYKNIFYKNIEAEICEILRIF